MLHQVIEQIVSEHLLCGHHRTKCWEPTGEDSNGSVLSGLEPNSSSQWGIEMWRGGILCS